MEDLMPRQIRDALLYLAAIFGAALGFFALVVYVFLCWTSRGRP
jgi:hypothetical protein